MKFLARLQRELPDTDKDRYDVAYEQGRTQARSGLLFGGLLLGALSGALTMFLLDPARGAGRRAQLASRATGLRNTLAKSAAGRAQDLQNRAKGAAIESGVAKPEAAKPEAESTYTGSETRYTDLSAREPTTAGR